MFFNPMALLYLFGAVAVGFIAHRWISKVYRDMCQVGLRSQVSGAEAASAVLSSAGVNAVFVEDVPGQLLDHYSPQEKGLLLRTDVYEGRSVAAVGIAAHEIGHALQDADGYKWLQARTAVVLLATFGSLIGMILMAGGLILVEEILIYSGVALYCLTVVVQLANLYVEFDASGRSMQHLRAAGIVAPDEVRYVRKVMTAAACTYVAATLTAVPTAYHYLFKAGRTAGDKTHV
jgi:Zn-dependent membrane protease YugP